MKPSHLQKLNLVQSYESNRVYDLAYYLASGRTIHKVNGLRTLDLLLDNFKISADLISNSFHQESFPFIYQAITYENYLLSICRNY